jgi:hypothetical protein
MKPYITQKQPKTMKVKINAQTCLFEQTSFVSIPPFIPKSKHLNTNKITT